MNRDGVVHDKFLEWWAGTNLSEMIVDGWTKPHSLQNANKKFSLQAGLGLYVAVRQFFFCWNLLLTTDELFWIYFRLIVFCSMFWSKYLHFLLMVLITNNIYFHENRTEIYGPAFRINLLHYVMVFVSCPETTKVSFWKEKTLHNICAIGHSNIASCLHSVFQEMLMSPKYTKDKFLHDKIANLFGLR